MGFTYSNDEYAVETTSDLTELITTFSKSQFYHSKEVYIKDIGKYVKFDYPSKTFIQDNRQLLNYLSLDPNGDQTIVVTAPSVITLTPPKTNSTKAIINAPVDLYVRFGATPTMRAGKFYPVNTDISLDSEDQVTSARILVTAPCTVFVQYYQ